MGRAKKIAVLGGGNGAHVMAADLTLKGFEVRMCETGKRVGRWKNWE